MQINISQITIGERKRKDYGDMDNLIESIGRLGLLQPIGVDSNYHLIFGERRIKAHIALGFDSIEGMVINLDSLLDGEFAENNDREDFKPSEMVAILKAIETIGSGARTDIQPRQYIAEVNKVEAAKQAGFGNKETARQATKAVDNGIPKLVDKMDAGEIAILIAATID